jgi:FMN-dependent NADH-azoreductase
MSKLLYIQASPRGKRSKSNAVADAFIEAFRIAQPQDEVETLNVFTTDLPAFDGFTVQAKYSIMHGKEHSSEEAAAWKTVEKVIEQFKSADKYLLSVPMWNFSIPYCLKQYIDILVQPGYTFTYDQEKGYQGLIKDKPLLVIYARGGEYAKGTESEVFDFQSKYIELIFGFIGFTDIISVVVEPTLQGGEDTTRQKVDAAIKEAEQFASSF